MLMAASAQASLIGFAASSSVSSPTDSYWAQAGNWNQLGSPLTSVVDSTGATVAGMTISGDLNLFGGTWGVVRPDAGQLGHDVVGFGEGPGWSTGTITITGVAADAEIAFLGAVWEQPQPMVLVGSLPATVANPGPMGGDFCSLSYADGTLTINMNESMGVAGIQLSQVPEPATMSLLVLGGIATLIRRRNRRA